MTTRADIRETILGIMGTLLRPIVKICLRNSITLGDVVEVLKRTFVNCAKEELLVSGEAESASRISVISGVHRKDVSAFLKSKGSDKPAKNFIVRVIGHWQQDRRFRTKSGTPKVLSIVGKSSEFVRLVNSVSADLNPYTVLFELERLDLVERSAHGLSLKKRLYLPEGDVKEGFKLLGLDIEDLSEAVQENVLSPQAIPNHHIKTEYDNIPLDCVPQIKQWLFKEGSQFHHRVRNYLSEFDRDISNSKDDNSGRARVAFGSFGRVELCTKRKKEKA